MSSKDQPTDLSSTMTAPVFKYSMNSEVEEYNIPFIRYAKTSPSFAQYPPDTKLAGATGSVIFYNNKTLIVQRAPTDSMPLRWETPGGACDDTDGSIMDSAARELFEESGLVAKAMVRLLNRYAWLHPRVGLITKFVFEVEIGHAGDDMPKITLDPKEHCAYRWVTKEEVEAVGDGGIAFTSSSIRGYILAGFAHQDSRI